MKNKLVNKLETLGDLTDQELKILLETDEYDAALFEAADRVRRENYGDAVYIRGLIEFTNYCKNNCYYCGIRRDNRCAERYRLQKEHILACCKEGYALGFRTFVLQGGEDPYFTDERVCEIVSAIREAYPDCAITLSIGEKSKESYEKYFKAGANRYLLRHETANDAHYRTLHPEELSPEVRKSCLYALKEIGFQVGSGFMVGSPGQTTENLIEDLRFLQKLSPDMIGIGPYITHAQTPFANEKSGTLELTLRLVAVLRLMFPWALLPSTTALGTIHPEGREMGLKAGANVVMPNLSPSDVRALYTLYDNKIHSGAEAAQSVEDLKTRVQNAGYCVVVDAGHVKR